MSAFATAPQDVPAPVRYGTADGRWVLLATILTAVEDLLDALSMPRTLRDAGVAEQDFLDALPELAMTAFEDLSNRTNPRMPLVSELTNLLRRGYYGMSGSAEAARSDDRDGQEVTITLEIGRVTHEA